MFNIFMLALGFAMLIKGADIFVGASVGIAKKLRIPSVIIGLTIVAMGTSAPEVAVSVTASLAGTNSLALGVVIGSNIYNLVFIVGFCAILKPIPVNFKEISRDFYVSIAAAAILLVIILISGDYVSRLSSLILLIAFSAYMVVLIRQAIKIKSETPEQEEEKEVKPRPMYLNIILAVAGCTLIVFGGQFTVDSAVDIALRIGISERIVGLTIVAIGTSLPELVISITACRKGETGIALGNIVGSNIFNILFILGIAGLISPLVIDSALIIDLAVLIGGSLLALWFVYTRKQLTRFEGLLMVGIYAAYMIFVIFNT